MSKVSPILMEEGYWMNSHLSIARHYGGYIYNDCEYLIVNKFGITLKELSDKSSPHYVGDGDDVKAIPPGEPADLVKTDWIPVYKTLGREKFIEYIETHPGDLDKAMEYINTVSHEEQ